VLASRPAPELLSEVSGNIDQIVRSLGNLLNGLLDLSRLSAGYYVPERTQVRLDSLILGVCAEFDQAAAQKGLSLTHSLGPVQLLGDPVAIGRIARNLLDNAIKYTDQGSVAVAVRTETIDTVAHAVLSVTDTGRGIAESEHERIFEEFYQLDNPGRDRSRGVGLGLAIVHRLCEMGGAQVAVDSVVGQGSCFRVTLGAALATSAAPDPSPPQAAQDLLRGKRVYVVDDEIDIRKSMDTLLGIWGIQALTADSPPALGLLFEHHGTPDLLIVDLRLGDAEHGTRLAHRLQAQYGEFGVLIITGETSSEALRHANERNYPLLQKPVVPEVLRRAIMEAFNASAVSAR
jgi:CheY-like chemotaxis protein